MADISPTDLGVPQSPSSRLGLESLDHPRRPELVIGLVAPIGTPLQGFVGDLSRALEIREYTTHVYRVTKFLEEAGPYVGPEYQGSDEFVRYMRLMTHGDVLRETTGTADILALYAASEINTTRPDDEAAHMPGVAHVIRQLKHPEEVYRLRSIYGEAFVLLGLYCPVNIRRRHLRDLGMSDEEVEVLIRRDQEESAESGQKLVDTFHLADVFLEVRGAAGSRAGRPGLEEELSRFLDLLLGIGIVTPTRDEFAMFVAYAAALRSSSLARQVGAAIVSPDGELLTTGTNEVPAFGGGQYWGEAGRSDARDHKIGGDLSNRKEFEIVAEVLARLSDDWEGLDERSKAERTSRAMSRLKGTQLLGLTEFMRAVHAEMEAISAAVRIGVKVRGATMYSTTFPCHNCAKHIVAAGLEKVIYIEPYSKSRAVEMHGDALTVEDEAPDEGKVQFLPFVGVAPRKYVELFGRSTREGRKLKAKNALGEPLPEIGFRLGASPYSYVQREAIAATSLKFLKQEYPDAFTKPA